MDQFFDRLDKHWRALPKHRQRRITLCCFIGYLLLTALVIYKTGQDSGRPENNIVTRHIQNPALKTKQAVTPIQDSLQDIFKNRNHERE